MDKSFNLISISARFILLFITIWIALTITVSYLISMHFKYVAKCIPFISGCTDITHTGMYPPAEHIYIFGMIAAPAMISFLWLLIANWLIIITNKPLPKLMSFILICAVIGSFCLSLSEALIMPNSKLVPHVIFSYLFFLTALTAQLFTTFYIQKYKSFIKGQKLRLLCIASYLILSFLSFIDVINSAALSWCVVSFVIIWFLSFYSSWKGYYLSSYKNNNS